MVDEKEKQGKISEFISEVFKLAVSSLANPKTGITAFFVGLPAIYAPFAYYMSQADPANGMIWQGSVLLVAFASAGLGKFITTALYGFDTTTQVKAWVAEEQEDGLPEGITIITEMNYAGKELQKALINWPIFYATYGLSKVKADFAFSTENLPVKIVYGTDVWDEQQCQFSLKDLIVHSMVADPVADEKPKTTPQIIDEMLKSAHPFQWLLDRNKNNVALKLDIVLAPVRQQELIDNKTLENYVTNFLDVAVANHIQNIDRNTEAQRAIELYNKYMG